MNCPSGTNYNPSTKTCDKITGSIALCPPEKPWYNPDFMACQKCPSDKPNYDSTINQCTSDQSGSISNKPKP